MGFTRKVSQVLKLRSFASAYITHHVRSVYVFLPQGCPRFIFRALPIFEDSPKYPDYAPASSAINHHSLSPAWLKAQLSPVFASLIVPRSRYRVRKFSSPAAYAFRARTVPWLASLRSVLSRARCARIKMYFMACVRR